MRIRKNKRSRFYRIIIILFIFIAVTSVSYGYLSTQLNITGYARGITTGNDYVVDYSGNPNLRLSKPTINKWQEGSKYKYQYNFTLENIGNTDYDNFTMIITYNNNFTVDNLWNYQYTTQSKILTITNIRYDLLAHDDLEIGYILSSNKQDFKITHIKIIVITEAEEIDPSKFEVVFTKTGSWGNYTYQYDMTLTNKTGKQITYWQIQITLPEGTMFYSGWNGIFTTNGNDLIIENTSYNGRIDNNASTTVGLQINTNIVNYVPTNPKVTVR